MEHRKIWHATALKRLLPVSGHWPTGEGFRAKPEALSVDTWDVRVVESEGAPAIVTLEVRRELGYGKGETGAVAVLVMRVQ